MHFRNIFIIERTVLRVNHNCNAPGYDEMSFPGVVLVLVFF